MNSPEQSLARASQHHEAGEFAQAAAICTQLVRAYPGNADAWNLLGILNYQTGNTEAALDCFAKACRAAPTQAGPRCNRGAVLQGLGRAAEAEAEYRDALRLDSHQPAVHNNLGAVLQDLGRFAEAESCHRRAVGLNPAFPEAHNNLGNVLRKLGRRVEAETSYRLALRLQPNFPEALNNLGAVLRDLAKLAEAETCYRRALQLQPANVDAINNLAAALIDQDRAEEALPLLSQAVTAHPTVAVLHGNLGHAFRDLGQRVEAEACYRRVLELEPPSAGALSNLAAALIDQDRAEEALPLLDRAVAAEPALAEVHSHFGTAFNNLGRHDEAEASYRRALQLKPDCVHSHFELAMLMLLKGDYEHGWAEYDWRRQIKNQRRVSYPQPFWDGSPLAGRTILLQHEQGFGDSIFFIRYASRIKAFGATVIVQCPQQMVDILKTCPGVDDVVPSTAVPPPFDVRAQLPSLPGLFGTTAATIPNAVPYLAADPQRVDFWRNSLAEVSGFKVGIVWQGNPKHVGDRRRSVPLSRFEPLAHVPGVRLISLQKGVGAEQALDRRFPLLNWGQDLDDSFMDAAALLSCLDLVIVIDTAVVHLAGALAVPVWAALPHSPDWRWLLGRDDSPWYPSVRLFRQPHPGAWDDVFARLTRELTAKIDSRAAVST